MKEIIINYFYESSHHCIFKFGSYQCCIFQQKMTVSKYLTSKFKYNTQYIKLTGKIASGDSLSDRKYKPKTKSKN